MREESIWFSKREEEEEENEDEEEEELPSPDELMPISQTLITPNLAMAFDIGNSGTTAVETPISFFNHHHHSQQPSPPLLHHHNQSNSTPNPPHHYHHHHPNSSEFESSSAELGAASGSGGGGDEPARTLKRPRLVWTPQLHKRFVDAVAHLGIKNAVPKTIMQLMSVDGLTRENVASHLQKYRLYLKRMQNLNNGGGGGGPGSSIGGSGDPATDHLFASSPVPPHFLHQQGQGNGVGRPNSEQQHFMPYMPVAAAALHHHHHVAAAVAVGGGGGGHPQIQTPYQHHHRQMGGGHLDQHPYLSRHGQVPIRNSGGGYVEDVESGTANNGRKVLTLFPTGDD